MRIASLVVLLTLASAFAGCMGGGAESTDTTPVVTPSAHFQVASLNVTPENDSARSLLYEDDGAAVVRYVVRQPADAPRETAFITYLLDGRIVDVQQVAIEPGEEKSFERRVPDLLHRRAIDVEVRAGSSSQKAHADVLLWPRAGSDTLVLGPLKIRADYGLLEQDSRVLVNLTLDHVGPEQTFRDFRVKMLCLGIDGQIHETHNVRVEWPTLGNATGVDVSLEDCRHTRYGLEFKANAEEGREIFGRLLLVPPP